MILLAFKTFQELLLQQKCIKCVWSLRDTVVFVFASGILVTIDVTAYGGDIEHILVDKTLVGKLSGDNACDGIVLIPLLLIG